MACLQGYIERVQTLTSTFDFITKINKVTPRIIHNLHVKFESYLTKAVVCIVSQVFIYIAPKFTLPFDPMTHKQNGSSSYHPQLACEVWKRLSKNYSPYFVRKV